MAMISWCEMFPSAEVRVLEVTTLDHLPLLLQLHRQVFVQRSRRFKFENMWIEERECRGIVQSCWREEEKQSQLLAMPIVEEEVKKAVFKMIADKSPGVDGLFPGSYQAYWEIVGTNVVEFCRTFFDTGELTDGVNQTLVCLIPKVKHPKKQSAFIEGRLLTDNALVAYEINHYIHRKTQGRTRVAALKVDVSKAYDRLEWSYIESMMGRYGFPSIWIERVMQCVKTVSYSFLRNSDIFGGVVPHRGIRQGDLISPYLYILCAEGLSGMIRENEKSGLLHGCKIANKALSISHLLFADDCYFFLRATKSEAQTLKNVLRRYEAISGQCGGLGMRETRKFNLSMLAKQGWWLLKETNSLVSAIMKAKYYPNFSFLNATVGTNPSYAWRSIMAAIDVVKVGARKRIGNGRDTRIWGDPWLPDIVDGYVRTPMHVQLQQSSVHGLIQEDACLWDFDIIQDIFQPRDFELIKQIPVPRNRATDSWFWLFDKKGEYTVKSKVTNFLWRFCTTCLPTSGTLVMKQVNIGGLCPWCHSADETDTHVLFECGFAKSVWNMAGVLLNVQYNPNDAAGIVIRKVFNNYSGEQCVQLGMMCWSLWNRKNRLVWEKINGSVFGVVAATNNLLRD
ncbi:uncharacterized protein LOC141684875 [Apium graveolens]|uniref:uncharacterized protein LOC141684875 n=1 Tax=Apium graveolens TaxID=4045 RepID=UPI003D78E6C7